MTMSSGTNNTSRLTMSHPNTTTTATIPIIRSTIDDFREIVREQSFLIPTNSTDISVKKYPPLPDISGHSMNNTFFRTETILTPSKQPSSNKQIYNHFASTQRGHLPALNQRHTLPNTISTDMDLNEDLPQCYTNIMHRPATYTAPGERIVSPIKRPSAPSPPTSAQIKRFDQNSYMDNNDEQDDDEDESQFFEENFSRYQQPIIMSHHRIDHYNPHGQFLERHPTIIINDGYDEPTHPLDLDDFEP